MKTGARLLVAVMLAVFGTSVFAVEQSEDAEQFREKVARKLFILEERIVSLALDDEVATDKNFCFELGMIDFQIGDVVRTVIRQPEISNLAKELVIHFSTTERRVSAFCTAEESMFTLLQAKQKLGETITAVGLAKLAFPSKTVGHADGSSETDR